MRKFLIVLMKKYSMDIGSFSTYRAVQDLVDAAFDELFFVPVWERAVYSFCIYICMQATTASLLLSMGR